MTQASTVHTSVKRRKETASNIRGYANAVDAANHVVLTTALERSLHIERWESKQVETPEETETTRADHCSAQRTKHPVRPFCANPKTRFPSQRRTRRSKRVRKFAGSRVPARSLAYHQSFSTWRKVPMWIQAHSLKGPVCCGSALACPCCRHGRWSCARSSCPRYCVGWARIACQR
jgi:hypothetical protein